MKFKEYDLLAGLVAALLTTVILVIDFVGVLAMDPSILDGALLFGFFVLMYHIGISRPRD